MIPEGASVGPAGGGSKFTALMWSGTVISAFFVGVRLFLRIKAFRKLFADDAMVLAGWLMMLARSIILQCDKDAMFVQWATNKQEYLPHKASAVVTSVLFLTGLWAIKLSFLIFFWRLGHNVRGQKHLWWSITGITAVSLVACLGIPWWKCLQGTRGELDEKCSATHATDYQRIGLQVGTSLDIITDALIMVIPFTLLWNVRINWRQKLALSGIFSMTIFVIAFAIVRIMVANLDHAQADQVQLYLWSNAEMAMAVTVASVGPFRQFFVIQERGHAQASPIADRIRTFCKGVLNRMRYIKKSGFSDDIILGSKDPNTGWRRASPSSSSTDPTVQLHGIHVRHDIGVSSGPLGKEQQPAKTTIESHYLRPDAS